MPQCAMCNPCPRREMEPLCEFQTHHQAFDHLSRLPDGTALLLQEWGLLLVRQRAAGWVHILNSQMLAQPAEVEGSGTLNHQFVFQLLDAEKLLHLNLDPFYEVLRPLAELLPELCHDVWPDQEQDTRLRGLDELDEGDDHRQDMCQVIETLGNTVLKVVNKISTGNWSNDAIWKELENAHDAMGQAFQRKFPRFASSLLGHAQSSGGDELCRFLHCHLQGHTVFSEAFAKKSSDTQASDANQSGLWLQRAAAMMVSGSPGSTSPQLKRGFPAASQGHSGHSQLRARPSGTPRCTSRSCPRSSHGRR